MQIRWLGHSTFHIAGDGGQIVIDPFLTHNPKAPCGPEDLAADVVLLTHDHDDHIGDLEPVLEHTGATLVSVFENTQIWGEKGFPVDGGNIGGTIEVKGIKIHFVNAVHSAKTRECGFIFELDGKSIYHMGDTALFGDLALYGKWFDIDLAMVPIGDRFTMGPKSAGEAVRMCGAKAAIPMHFGTWPPIEQDPQDFVAAVGDAAQVVVLEPGQTHEL